MGAGAAIRGTIQGSGSAAGGFHESSGRHQRMRGAECSAPGSIQTIVLILFGRLWLRS